jgi:hypothetical protein
MRWISRLTVLTAGTCLTLALAGPAGASGGWKVQPTPAGNGVSLAGVWCTSLSRCIAVGDAHAERWNGSKWVPLPSPSRAGVLSAVACTSARHCIAVGSSVGHRAAAWSWNGSKWRRQSVANPKSPDNALAAITCVSARSCEAVGAHGSASFNFPLAEKWNGKTWVRQSTTGAPDGSLAGVACESRSNCEAVGQRDASSVTTLAMRWNGSKWRTQRTPVIPDQFESPPGEPYVFSGISCWSSGCTAVGTAYYCDCSPESSGYILLAEKWNGSKWRREGKLGSGVSPSYNSATWSAVHCTSASACTAVGEWTDDNEAQAYFTLVSQWNGSRWSQVRSPSPNGNGNLLNAIACTSSACTAVGVQGNFDSEDGDSLAMRN